MDEAEASSIGKKAGFFREKNQKAFAPSPASKPTPLLPARALAEPKQAFAQAGDKSFLVLFLEKGLLSSLPQGVSPTKDR